MMIDVQRIKDLNPIEDVVEEKGFKLERRGRGKHFKGTEHDSFVVNVDEQLYFWNSQQRGGDVVQFLQQECKMSFVDAMRYLAERAHMPLELDEATAQRMAAERQRTDALTAIMQHLQRQLQASQAALAYCHQRGWVDATIEAARIGFWDGDKKALAAHAQLHGIQLDEPAVQAIMGMPPGMLVYGHWLGARCAYVSGRSIKEKRHHNAPKDLLGDKQPFWNYIKPTDELVLVEGQADAISLAQLEVPALALAGLQVGDLAQLAKALKQYGTIYVALDGDEAGQAGIGKLAEVLGAMVRVVEWPGGHKDANEWLVAGASAKDAARLLRSSMPYVVTLARQVVNAPPAHQDAARLAALQVIAQLEPIDLALWRDELKNMLGMSVGAMNAAIKAIRSQVDARQDAQRQRQRQLEPGGDGDDLLLRTQLLKQPADHEGHAQCTLALYPERFAFVPQWGWMAFDGQRWQRTGAEALVERAITHTLRQRQSVAGQAQNEDLYKASGASHPNVAGTRMQLQSSVTLDTDDFDNAPDLLNVGNGVLDLRTGQLVDHTPSARFTYCLDVDYVPEALDEASINWLAWLYQALAYDDPADTIAVVDWLQEVCGYALTGHIREECFVYMYGPSRSGKGTFAETLMQLMGYPLAVEVKMETFTSERDGDRQNFDLAALSASRLVFADETANHKRLNATGMKHLTGGGQIFAAHKFKEHFNYTPKFMILMASNWQLNMDADDNAAWGRARVIHFPHSWLGNEDRTLKARMKTPENLQAVLAWAVEGAKRWYERGYLEVPEPVTRFTEQHRTDQDLVAEFLRECCTVAEPGSKDHFTGTTDLHQVYTRWCKDGGMRPKGRAAFKTSMREKGYGDGTSDRARVNGKLTRGYYGIQLEGAEDGQAGLEL